MHEEKKKKEAEGKNTKKKKKKKLLLFFNYLKFNYLFIYLFILIIGEKIESGAIPAYLLDRENVSRAKVLSNMVKQKRKEKAGKWNVPLPKVRAISEDEMFKVLRTGKRKSKVEEEEQEEEEEEEEE